MAPRTRNDDDLLQELPPIDDGEGEGDPAAADDDLGIGAQEDRQDLDDAEASELPVGDLIVPLPSHTGAIDGDSSDLDVGAPELDLLDAPERTRDDEADGMAAEDSAIGIDAVPEHGAAGGDSDELPGASGDEVDEGALPRLDSDDDADLPGGLAMDEAVALADEAPMPPWAANRWEKVADELPAWPVNAIAAAPGRLALAGPGLAWVASEPAAPLHASHAALSGAAAEEFGCLALGRSGVVWLASPATVYVSDDDGATARVSITSSANIVGLCTFGAGVCATLSDGTLLLERGTGLWQPADVTGELKAVTEAENGSLLALVVEHGRPSLASSTDGEVWRVEALELVSQLRDTWLLAAGANRVVVGSSRGVLACSQAKGARWQHAHVPAELTCLAVRASGEVLGTFFVESEDKSYLFRLGSSGSPELLAELSPAQRSGAETDEAEGVGRAGGLVWDEARGLLWVAGRFGLQAWRPGSQPAAGTDTGA